MILLKKYLILFLFIFTIQSISLGSNDNSETYDSDTAYINKCIEQCRRILFIYPDSAKKYTDTILSLSIKTNYEYGLFNSYNLKGILYWISNDLDKALEQYKLALKYANSAEDLRRRAVALSNIGLVYSNKYMIDSAVYYFEQTIQYSEENNVEDMHTKALFDLSNLYLNQDNYSETARYLFKVRDVLEINEDSLLLMYVYSTFGILYSKVNEFELSLYNYNKAIELDHYLVEVDNIANNYINIGELFFNLGDNYDSAIYYYRKAISVALPHTKRYIELSASINSGNVFLKKMQLDSAKYYYQSALGDTLIQKYQHMKAAVTVNLGIYYFYKNDLNNSRLFIEFGYDMADKLGILRYKKNALELMTSLDSASGRFQEALQHYKSFHIISDSLQASKASNEIAILEFNKYLEQQSYNNQVLLNENKLKGFLIWLSLLAIFILLLLLFLLIRNRLKIKRLLKQLSDRHIDLRSLNEELTVTNEVLNTQQEQLKALNITKDKFFSILGHDLKSPFNSLLGLIGLINKDWEVISDEKKQKLLQSLYSSSKKTYHLLEDLLDWGKAQQGLIKYKPEIFLLYPKIQVITDLFEVQLKNKQQQLTINVSPELTINTDIRLFSQIMQNFLNNAIKYTHKGGSITIEAETINGKIHLCVIDTGIGIPNAKISSLFDLDSEFNRPGTDKEQSTGMGLILSKEYAELMNAKLTVSSIEEKGSKFCLIIDTSN